MSSGDWLSEMNPPPPAELASAMRNALRAAQEDAPDRSPTPEQLLRAGETLLEKVLASDCEKREAALDLLAVDALITHALEVASRDPQRFEDFPDEVLARMSAVRASEELPGTQ